MIFAWRLGFIRFGGRGDLRNAVTVAKFFLKDCLAAMLYRTGSCTQNTVLIFSGTHMCQMQGELL